jgi:pyruvate/2-oxoglutarate dehydrogenase complex dihydrolipoamide acyltransferase (E2) component
MVTDKATFNVPAPATGVLKEVTATEGDKVQVGSVMAVIEGA